MQNLLTNISTNLILKDKIWFAKGKSDISYPNDGNQNCYQIEESSFWFKHRNNCIVSVVNKFAGKKIFFDIGGGNGFTALALEKNDIQTVLVEPGIAGVLNAQKRELKNVICSTSQDAGFIDNSIPNIGIFDVLEHIENDIDFLKHLHQILEKEGKLFITVPAFKFLWSNDDDFAGHFRRYTLKQLKKALKKANFEIEYSTYIFSILPLPIFIFRTIPSWFKPKTENLVIEEAQNEHKANKTEGILDAIWNKEISLIQKGKKIPFGGSCLIVAKKIKK